MPTISLEIRRKCKVCGKVFIAKTLDSHHCSDKCRKFSISAGLKRKREARLEQIASQVPEVNDSGLSEGDCQVNV